jgi:hypothetical protein
VVRALFLTTLLIVAAVLVGGVAAVGWCIQHRLWLAAVQLAVESGAVFAAGSITLLLLLAGVGANE